MATNEGPKEDSTGTQSNPEGRPVVPCNNEELSENAEFETLFAIVSENLSEILNCPSGMQDEVDSLVQGVVDDLTRNELLSDPLPPITYAPSTSGMGSTQKSNSEPVATSNNENSPLPETPTVDSNLVLEIGENSETIVMSSNLLEETETDSKVAGTNEESRPVLQTTVDPCQSKSVTTSNNFSISSDKNYSISETTVDPCKKSKHLINSQPLTRTTTESCTSNANETAINIVVKSPVIKTTVDSSTQVEPNDIEPILENTIENRSIFETAGTSGESRLSLGARVDASIPSTDVEKAPEAHSFQEPNDARNTSQIQVLQEPNENAANSTNLEEINQESSVEKNYTDTKCTDDEISVEGTRSSITGLTTSSSNSSTSTDTDSTSDSSDDSQRIKKRKIEIIEEADKYPDSIFKKPKFLGRDEKVPLGEIASSSTSGKCCSDVSISEEDRDKENKKKDPDMEGSEPNELGVSVGDGSRQEGPAPDDRDEGLGAEPDRSSGVSDEGFAHQRRPPTPPPRARGARRSTRIRKYPKRLIYYRKDQLY